MEKRHFNIGSKKSFAEVLTFTSDSSKVKATILLPNSDNYGDSLVRERQEILEILYDAFDGYTLGNTVTGVYRLESGDKVTDRNTPVLVILYRQRVPELRAMVKQWGKLLRQETMYLDIEPFNVEFVESAE